MNWKDRNTKKPRARNKHSESLVVVVKRNNTIAKPRGATPKTTRPKRKTVTPPLPQPPTEISSNDLSSKEVRKIKLLIEQSVTLKQGVDKKEFSSPMSRCEQIYISIENVVERCAEIRRRRSSNDDCIDQDFFHPEMQKLIKLQVCVVWSCSF